MCSHAPLVSASGAILDYIQTAACTKATRVAYFDTLDAASKQRYLDKIAIVGSQDPYLLKNDIFSSDPNEPDAYKQFVSGWAWEVRSTVINGIHLVAGRVIFLNFNYLLWFIKVQYVLKSVQSGSPLNAKWKLSIQAFS